MTPEAEAAKKEAHIEMLERLAESQDFLAFIGGVLDEFCAFTQGYGEVDSFHQGVRAAGSYIIGEISKTEKGRKAVAALFEKTLSKNH